MSLEVPYINSYKKIVNGITSKQVWTIWSDINKRPIWDDDTEWAKIYGEFKAGNKFIFKPVGGPKLTLHITECIINKSFTDCFKFPLAKLYGIHELTNTADGLEIKTTIIVKGILAWLWQKLVAEKIVKSLPHQTDLLIKAVREIKLS